jgi:chromosome segregation protein
VRLTKLKLSGFKSFVEPTVVLFPGRLAGVVGPNGCGKSNIIDAVRWVLGESKASELRGESIQDVIFKGSGNRKEVSRASVELYFDNDQGRAAGQWSQYAEITVKRVLDREGNSSYYINNLHVRRRDVIDLFLGTGLGPRAYAIIGQGMISRIVEAKPEELRFFLEEAAGVTKYKERRKETEHRLEDARENVARVDDIRNELEGQIGRLESQAEVARQYRELNEQLNRRQNLLWLKKTRDARADAQKFAAELDKSSIQIEAETARLREIEAQVERAREAHFSASDAVHSAQAEMYAASNEVGRLEAEIARLKDSRQRLEQRLIQLESEEQHWKSQQSQLGQDSARWRDLLENARERSMQAAQRHAEAAQRLPIAEAEAQQAAAALAEARRALSEAEQGARLAEVNRGHAQRAIENLQQRRARIEQEHAAVAKPDEVALAAAQAAHAESEQHTAAQQSQLMELQARLPDQDAALQAAREGLQQAHRQVTEARARRDALQQLQDRVQRGEIHDWLTARGLADSAPLWKSLKVDAGWETAVEAVLRERLSALSATPEVAREALVDPPPNTLALAFSAGQARSLPQAEGLRAKIRVEDPVWQAAVDEWLQGVYAADELSSIDPQPGTVWVNREGHLRTAHGLLLYVPDTRTHGVIERQREIEDLNAQISVCEEREVAAREIQSRADSELVELQAALARYRRDHQESQQRTHALQVEALKLTQAQARYLERVEQISKDLADIQRSEETEKSAQLQSDAEATRWREQLAAIQERVEQALNAQREKDQLLREVRALEQQLSREAQESSFSERECIGKLEDIDRSSATAGSQLERIQAESGRAREELSGISDSVLQEQLQAALTTRQERETLLSERRNAIETAAGELRGLDEARLKLEQGLGPVRDRINDLRLKQQAAQLNEEQFRQRLIEANVVSEEDEAALATDLVPGLKDSSLQGEITRLSADIESLGPVNLAALEELKSAAERKGFLDEQSGDLTEAIHTLEDAIRRIDRETREQLQETYDTVNSHFGTLFPQLFGGGEARLVLTGEEILDAGIQIMAHPPGKKNSTIHLLSGGEKALTAIALVFAMFQLNPAPFCLLDEVDAPLDDSNTERFCNLVKRMSQQTQFIFISHNKIAMEMAQQLIGVTMQEQGVSRVVEVDIEEALRLSEEQAA